MKQYKTTLSVSFLYILLNFDPFISTFHVVHDARIYLSHRVVISWGNTIGVNPLRIIHITIHWRCAAYLWWNITLVMLLFYDLFLWWIVVHPNKAQHYHVYHWLLIFFIFFVVFLFIFGLCPVYPMLSMSLDCPFLIATSGFSGLSILDCRFGFL